MARRRERREARLDLAVTMSPGVLEHKLEEGEDGRESVWNTRKLPKLLVPGFGNRLFVACAGWWRGYFPLSGELLWNPDDEQAPYGLVFDSAKWRQVPRRPAPKFRGWRYVEGDEITAPLPPSPAS